MVALAEPRGRCVKVPELPKLKPRNPKPKNRKLETMKLEVLEILKLEVMESGLTKFEAMEP